MEQYDRNLLMAYLLDMPRLFQRALRSLPPEATPQQVVLIGILHAAGPMNMTRLSTEVMVSNQQMTRLVDGLEQKGLVRRTADPNSRRSVLIEVSEAGADLVHRLQEEFIGMFLPVIGELSAEEQKVVWKAVSRLRETLCERDGAKTVRS